MKRSGSLYLLPALLLMAACDPSVDPVREPDSDSFQTLFRVADSSAADEGDSVDVTDTYIVTLHDGVSNNGVDLAADELGRRHRGTLKRKYKNAMKGFAMRLSASDAAGLANDPRVRRVEPDGIAAVKPSKPVVVHRDDTPVLSWGITRVGGSRNGTGKIAWIIDTGIDMDNPDLNVDRVRSRDFITKRGNDPSDGEGHGTHVAGIIGARDNNIGAVGVAANATLVSVRVLNKQGKGPISSIIAGIDYVAAMAAPGDVVNLSLTASASPTLDEAVRRIARRGIKVVISAGNESAHTISVSPSRVDTANVYTITAIDAANFFASFSNFGNPPVDFAAPGVDIISTRRNRGTVMMSGTSMAAPHVTGLLLLGSLTADGIAFGDFDGWPDPVAHY